MFSRMGRQRLAVERNAALWLDAITRQGVREKPEVSALASREANQLSVLVWHYHDDDVPGPDAAVMLTLGGLPFASGDARLQHFRIDQEHSNAFSVWQRMGSPQSPTPEQYVTLEKAGQLAALGPSETLRVEKRHGFIGVYPSAPGVSLLLLEWARSPR
jgi:xylan 1,4-beta-xylosidase